MNFINSKNNNNNKKKKKIRMYLSKKDKTIFFSFPTAKILQSTYIFNFQLSFVKLQPNILAIKRPFLTFAQLIFIFFNITTQAEIGCLHHSHYSLILSSIFSLG